MDWESVLKIVTAAITSIGGAGVIIWAIVRFAANHLSEKMLKKYDVKLNKDLEKYKHELELETEKYRKKSENLNFVTQKQYDTEHSAYQELFDNIIIFSRCTSALYPVFEPACAEEAKKREQNIEKYKAYCDAYNEFSYILEKNAPFMPEENYNLFVSIRELAHEIGAMYDFFKIYDDPDYAEERVKDTRENILKTREFNNRIGEARKQIRNYLESLRIEKE